MAKPKRTGSKADYSEAWEHFKQAAKATGRGAAKDAHDGYEWAKPRVRAAANQAAKATKEKIRNWYNNLSADERWSLWRKHGVLPISQTAKRKAAQINGIDAIDEAVILFELECKTTVIPRNDTSACDYQADFLKLQPLTDAEISGRKTILEKGWFDGMGSDDVRRLLEAHDFKFVSQKGSHVKYVKNNCHVVFPANKKSFGEGTFHSIKKQFYHALQNEDKGDT